MKHIVKSVWVKICLIIFLSRMVYNKVNAYRILVGKAEGKRPPGRPKHKWVDNIKMDLRETEWDGRDWIELAQDRDQWKLL
jgi:hypothetical protein